MNPELQRNVWLELTARRLTMMAIVLGVIFGAAALGSHNGALQAMGGAARFLFHVIVVFWGCREAAGAVVGEIRARTWDGQRLSALTPGQMLFGKILGAASYQWFGGLICLAVIALARLAESGVGDTVAEVLYFIAIGFFGQSMSLFASLVAVRKRASHSRFDIFVYQLVGLVSAWSAASVWDSAYVTRILNFQGFSADLAHLNWWGLAMPVQGFYLLSLFVFLFWSLVGNHALLASELQARQRPWAWIGFLAFMVLYMAGFADEWAAQGQGLDTVRLAIAIVTAGALTYAAILFEPKDPVLYRALLDAGMHLRFRRMLGGLQSWMSAFALLTVLVVYFVLTFKAPMKEVLGYGNDLSVALLAAYFFVARDIAIFLYFNFTPHSRRGDFGALVTLAVLYLAVPIVIGTAFGGKALALVLPNPQAGTALAVGAPAAEAALVWLLSWTRLAGLAQHRAEKAPA